MAAEPLFELRRRTFPTPQFRGIEFIEVEAKSIINHVPGNYLPFNWTINPYRGCSHACSYCCSGETPVLMGDGRSRPIRDLRPGDRIYGTTFDGKYRRYVTTDVLAHWQTMKRAYRVTLQDGTELVASGDHRFLAAARGWKHVVNTPPGQRDRAHLTCNDSLLGIGRLPTAPVHDDDYMRGHHSTGPVATLERTLEGAVVEQSTDLRVRSVEDLGIELPMYDITTGTGDFIANGVISHNCFARVTHTYMDMDAGRDFESKIVVKVNAPDLVRKELRAKRWKGEGIAMGTATDPYQRAEGRYRLMPGIIGALTDYGNPFSILTKGTLILRDLDLLVEAAARTSVTTAFSIGTVDDEVWRRSEPGTPHPRKRLEAVARLNEAGIPCGVMVAPILPGISDDPAQIREVVTAAIDAGATHVSPILLHLRPKVKEVYMAWLEDNYPDLVPRYQEMYARSSYAAAEPKKRLGRIVAQAIEAAGGLRSPRRTRRFEKKPRRDTTQPAQQLRLL